MTERVIAVGNIVSLTEIAERLGVTKTSAHNWTVRHPTFPKPICRVGVKQHIYDFSEVLTWKEQHPEVGVPGFKKGNTASNLRRDRQQPTEVSPKPEKRQTAPRTASAPSKTHSSQRGLWDGEKPFPQPPSRPLIGEQ